MSFQEKYLVACCSKKTPYDIKMFIQQRLQKLLCNELEIVKDIESFNIHSPANQLPDILSEIDKYFSLLTEEIKKKYYAFCGNALAKRIGTSLKYKN